MRIQLAIYGQIYPFALRSSLGLCPRERVIFYRISLVSFKYGYCINTLSTVYIVQYTVRVHLLKGLVLAIQYEDKFNVNIHTDTVGGKGVALLLVTAQYLSGQMSVSCLVATLCWNLCFFGVWKCSSHPTFLWGGNIFGTYLGHIWDISLAYLGISSCPGLC